MLPLGDNDEMARLWLLPNLLSLDAPLIALLWQDLLSRSTHLPLTPSTRAVLGLSVWSVYLADRILDARKPCTMPEGTRHQFYRKHPRPMWVLLGFALLGATVFVFQLPWGLVRAGLLVLSAVGVYLLAVHSGAVGGVPKELSVAILFPIGTFLAAWVSSDRPIALLALALPFFLLCLGNLCALETWEWRRWGIGAAPSPVVVWLADTLPFWGAGTGIACLGAGRSVWFLACGVSALLLAILAGFWRRLTPDVRRVLADAVLLTPLFLR